MNFFEMADGRRAFYQWDTGRRLIVRDDVCGEVHFCNGSDDCSLKREIIEQDGQRVVAVPDVLLQDVRPVTVFAYVRDAGGGYTKRALVFTVLPRTRPADYVYTEEDRKTWEALDDRITDLENNGVPTERIEEVVTDYLAEHPVQAGATAEQAAQIQANKEAIEQLQQSGGPGTPGAPGEDGEDGGYYTPAVTQPADNKLEISFTPSKAEMPAVDPVQVTLPAASDSGGNVDLTGYATEQFVRDGFQPKGDYLKSTELTNAVNTALAQAKASGEFDGADGKDGTDGKDGYTPQKGIDYFDGKDGQPGKDGEDGYTPVKGVDYFDGQPGKDGVDGKDGSDGYTPVKGKDYFDGKDGNDGQPGADGVSPTVAVSKSGKVTTISITDKNGTKTATINDGEDGEDATATDSVPDYVKTAADAVVDKIATAQTGRTFTFAAITDMHYGSWGYYEGVTDYRDGVNHACQALKYIDERIKLDAVAVLGDYTDATAQTQQSTAVADFKGVNAVLDKLRFAPNLRLQGNHDFVAEKSPIAYRYIGAYSDGAVEWGNPLGGYFLKDFATQKIRVICLNTSEIGNGGVDCSVAQYEWFVNSLDLSAKADASEWRILILSHVPLDMWANNGEYRFAYILDAYKNGKSWTDNTVSCDFSNGKNAAILVCNIHGHVHNFKVDKLHLGNIENSPPKSKVWRMATPNACFGAENKNYTGYQEETAYPKTADSANDTAFCVYCIDLDNYTIKAICYGAGYDRELTYYTEPGVVTYTNVLPISTDTSGNVYNAADTPGYKANTRWSGSSAAEKEYTGLYLSGYIPVKKGDIVRLKNVNFIAGGAGINCIWYWMEIGGATVSRDYGSIPDAVYDESGALVQFTVEGYSFMRICCSGFTADSIITINEEIE